MHKHVRSLVAVSILSAAAIACGSSEDSGFGNGENDVTDGNGGDGNGAQQADGARGEWCGLVHGGFAGGSASF